MDQNRNQFEAWWKAHGLTQSEDDIGYEIGGYAWAWRAWQAARAQSGGETVSWRPDFVAMHSAVDKYLSGYEMIGESPSGQDSYYTPTAADRALIQDFIAGLFCEGAFVAAISRTASPVTDHVNACN